MKGHNSTPDRRAAEAGTYHYLLQRFGPLLRTEHLAEVLHTTPRGLRMALERRAHPFAEALANALRHHGRRLYFETRTVADLIDNVHGPLADGNPRSPLEGER